MVGSVIQATGTSEFEDRLGRLLVPLWRLHQAQDKFYYSLRVWVDPEGSLDKIWTPVSLVSNLLDSINQWYQSIAFAWC